MAPAWPRAGSAQPRRSASYSVSIAQNGTFHTSFSPLLVLEHGHVLPKASPDLPIPVGGIVAASRLTVLVGVAERVQVIMKGMDQGEVCVLRAAVDAHHGPLRALHRKLGMRVEVGITAGLRGQISPFLDEVLRGDDRWTVGSNRQEPVRVLEAEVECSNSTHRPATGGPATASDGKGVLAGRDQILHDEVLVPLSRDAEVRPVAHAAIGQDGDEWQRAKVDGNPGIDQPGSVIGPTPGE